jgi:hypothetical protein
MIPAFSNHVEILQSYLRRRAAIVDDIEGILNCQKKAVEFQQDFPALSRQFHACFDGLERDKASLRDQLEQAHWASGFKPRTQPGNDLVDPVEQMLRGFHLWRQTHWPGQKGRLHFAQTLFNLYLVRCLALLCMRLWDDDADGASHRLAQAQAVLDAMWQSSPAEQPRLVRDIRWLFPVAMSPTTDSLAGYFDIAQRIADTFTEADRVETQKAWVQTGAGHLRSQLYHLARHRGVSLDDRDLVLLTRISNALDIALLVDGLVTLLTAYERCRQNGDERQRLDLASAICQGLSPDPDLFVNRLDLLGPYSMIEHLFVTTDNEGRTVYTPMGLRHLAVLQEYAALIERLAQALHDDWRQHMQTDTGYTPYGVLYGFASNLLELMAFKALQRDAVSHFSMEDAFTDGGQDKLAWVNGWRNLPHIKPDVVKQFEYPRSFVEDIGTRIEQALHQRVSAAEAKSATGRLFVLQGESAPTDTHLAAIPDLPLQYIVASDPRLVAGRKAIFKEQDDLLHCRDEGEFLVSYETVGGWLAITKDMLTDVLGAGRDVKIEGLPRAAADALGLLCPNLVVMQ